MTKHSHIFRAASLVTLAAASLGLAACSGGGGARDQISAVGSSTVFPFAKAIANQLTSTNPDIKSPIIESIGTGAGMKQFCAGAGADTPDIADASRRMKKSEYDQCQKAGVKEIVEVQIGLDGIAFGEVKGGPGFKLTPAQIYKALAANPFGKPNTAKNWNDVDPSLPAEPILVYGPPSTSGTRDALEELIMTKGCETDPAMKQLKESDPDKEKEICKTIRTDGPYVDSGENDNLIVQKIAANPKALGIFGFSYLEQNTDKITGVSLSGVAPTYATISDFSYPGARPLYIYVKKAHLNAIKGLNDFVNAFVANWGPDGLLQKQGMVIAPEDVRTKNAEIVKNMTVMDPSGLK